jgi:hypothetical protein
VPDSECSTPTLMVSAALAVKLESMPKADKVAPATSFLIKLLRCMSDTPLKIN